MKVSEKEFVDNFDLFLDMIEEKKVEYIIVESEKGNVVLLPFSDENASQLKLDI